MAGSSNRGKAGDSPLFLDSFIHDSHEKYKHTYPLLGIGLAVVIGIAFFMTWSDDSTRTAIGEAHYALHVALESGDADLEGEVLAEEKIKALEDVIAVHSGSLAARDAQFHIARLKVESKDPSGLAELRAWKNENKDAFPLWSMAALVEASALLDSGNSAEAAEILLTFTESLPEDSANARQLRMRAANAWFLAGEVETAKKQLGLLTAELETLKEKQGDDFSRVESFLLDDATDMLERIDSLDVELLARFIKAGSSEDMQYETYLQRHQTEAPGMPSIPASEDAKEAPAVESN
ncbi:MAG TPA: hypothetical protein DCR55_08365 [Lentisphaeria bacterium]|jgi:hypothetical protein|nr:hypothetical protein [Lentisphaeria bacterium]